MKRDKKGRFVAGCSGNPQGKKPGTRARATLAAEKLLEGEAEKLTRRCIELALAGDTIALRLCLERLIPPQRERTVSVPELREAKTPAQRLRVLLDAVADGSLAPGEALKLSQLMELEQAREVWPTAIFQAAVLGAIEELGPDATAKFRKKLEELRHGRRENMTLGPPAAP